MIRSTGWRFARALLMPFGAIGGFLLGPTLMMPDPAALRRKGEFVDGTGYGSAAILGLLGGIVVAYVVRTVLDMLLSSPDSTSS